MSKHKTTKQTNKKITKTKTHKTTNQTKKISTSYKNKSIRIITSNDSDDYKNDINVYVDIFKKLDFKIDIHILERDKFKKINIKYAPNSYYDINLFIDIILPLNGLGKDIKYTQYTHNDFAFFKTIFPSGVNIFAPNMNTFNNYKQLHYIDIILCNTRICYNFINVIKRENNYKFNAYYTNFTTSIPKQLLHIKTNTKTINTNKPMTFIHISPEQINKNTALLIHCWIQYYATETILDTPPELHIICNGLCFTNVLVDIKKMYKYDLLNTYQFKTKKYTTYNSIHTILNYHNLYLYLDLTSHDLKYKDLIKNANVAIYPSKKENYPHSINTARYFNTFVITLNTQPINELITNKGQIQNGFLLKNNKMNKKQYPDTKFIFIETIPDIEELRDSILWCIQHKTDINKYGINSRHHFNNDKKVFENNIKTICSKLKYNINTNLILNHTPETKSLQNISFNTLSTIIKQPSYKFYPESEEDYHCKYINIRGLINSCDIHSLTPISSTHDLIGYDMNDISDIYKIYDMYETNMIDKNSKKSKNRIYSIYVCNTAIHKFAQKLKDDKTLNTIKCRFILVSGDSDDTCPDDLFENENDFKEFIENDKIIHWYSQNYVRTIKGNTYKAYHRKLSNIPIGLAYTHLYNEDIKEQADKIVSPMKQEELLDSIIQNNKKLNLPFWKKELKCYINFNFEKNYIYSRFGYDRYEAITKLPKHLIFSEKGEVDRTTSWNRQTKYAFVASPFGNGLDTHRTWEALILGCIPIIKTSGMDSLFEELPVLIINDWSDITEQLLIKVNRDFKQKHEKGEFNYYKLTLKYWRDKIHSHKL